MSIDGRDVKTWDDLQMAVLPKANRPLSMVVERAGARRTITVTPAAETKYEFGTLGVGPLLRPQVVDVRPAHAGGARRDAAAATCCCPWAARRRRPANRTIAAIKKQGPNPFVIAVERDGQPLDLTVTPEGPAGSSLIGVGHLRRRIPARRSRRWRRRSG